MKFDDDMILVWQQPQDRFKAGDMFLAERRPLPFNGNGTFIRAATSLDGDNIGKCVALIKKKSRTLGIVYYNTDIGSFSIPEDTLICQVKRGGK